jgi:hypothetical protein
MSGTPLSKDMMERHNITGNSHPTHIRSIEEIIDAEERYLGRKLSPHETEMIKDRVKYLTEHAGLQL